MFLFVSDKINLYTVKNVSINISVGGHKRFCLLISQFPTYYGFTSVISLKSESKLLHFTHFSPSLSSIFFQWKSIPISKNISSEILESVCACSHQVLRDVLVFESSHDSIVSFDNCWRPFNLINQKRKFHFSFRYRFSNHFNSIYVEIKLSHANSFRQFNNFSIKYLKFWRLRAV